jgi:hypothetical protein
VRELERSALEKVFNALKELDEDGRARVLAWINDHFRYAPTGAAVPLGRREDAPGSGTAG